MRPQRQAAFGLWAALTFSCAVVVHGVIHAVGAHAFVWDSPAHVVMLAVAVGLLTGVAVPLGIVGPARERRRRLALVRAGLGPMRPALVLFGLAVQAGLAVALLAAEGAAIEPDRLAVTLLCGLVALRLLRIPVPGDARPRHRAARAACRERRAGIASGGVAPPRAATRARHRRVSSLRPDPAPTGLRQLTVRCAH